MLDVLNDETLVRSVAILPASHPFWHTFKRCLRHVEKGINAGQNDEQILKSFRPLVRKNEDVRRT